VSRFVITCSRNWADWAQAGSILRRVRAGKPEAVMVSGHNPRGDQGLEVIWTALGGAVETHPADWTGPCRPPRCYPSHRKEGRRGVYCPMAGYYRNEQMVDLPDVLFVLAFLAPCVKRDCREPLPHPSHGADSCLNYAEDRHIPVFEFMATILPA
jgi:hypothetical protein